MGVSQKVLRCNFAKSIQGANHIKKEEREENIKIGRKFPCQDKSLSCHFHASDSHKTPFCLVVVCDGHGGAPYFRSENGAEFAISSIRKILPSYIDKIAGKLSKETIQVLIPELLKEWKALIDTDLAEKPITETEFNFLAIDDPNAVERYKKGQDLYSIYGATFLCFVSAKDFWFALQIGDGDIAIHTDKGFFMPVPEDECNFLNQTTSLCDDDAQNEFRIAFGNHKIDAVLCSTDGIANSFANEEQLFSFYETVLTLFRTYDFDSDEGDADSDLKLRAKLAVKEIENSLPDISKRGSGDDITLAGFVDIDETEFKKHVNAKCLVDQGKHFKDIPLGLGNMLAERTFKEAAQKGYPEGYYQLGLMFLKKSSKEAIDFLSKAIGAGIKEAKDPLSKLLLEEGFKMQKEQKHENAFQYFLNAAEYGVSEAQYAVSLYYGRPQDYEGCGIKQNFAKAIEWTFAAAKQGHPEAECKIGKCYRDGRGVQQNIELSLEWYRKAAEHGSKEAKEYLAQLGEY